MWCLVTWFCHGFGSAEVIVGFYSMVRLNLKGLFQPKKFHSSMILSFLYKISLEGHILDEECFICSQNSGPK